MLCDRRGCGDEYMETIRGFVVLAGERCRAKPLSATPSALKRWPSSRVGMAKLHQIGIDGELVSPIEQLETSIVAIDRVRAFHAAP